MSLRRAAGASPQPELSSPRRVATAWLHRVAPFLPVLLFVVALSVLHHELGGARYHEVMNALRALPASRLLAAAGATVAGYLMLAGYDLLGARHAGAGLAAPRVALASFIGYSFSNTVGHALLTSVPLRFRLYAGWGASAEQIGRIVAFGFLTFWVGFLSLGGAVFTFLPGELPPGLHLPAGAERPLGIAFLVVVAAYLAASFGNAARLAGRRRAWLPRPRLALAQVAVASSDWALSAAVLWVLLPGTVRPSFPGFLASFLVAQLAGFLSQVPGGLGVFETVLLALLAPASPHPALLAALLAYRTVYYLLPLLAAVLSLAVLEVRRQRERVGRAWDALSGAARAVIPPAFAAVTFVAGALLLLTGATPTRGSTMAWINELLPLPVIEVSHFLGSVAGGLLLVLARGLQQRLAAARRATLGLLAGGIVFAVARGADWATAGALAAMLAALAPLAPAFDRRASLGATRFTTRWTAAVLLVLAATAWLTLFAYRHLDASADLWWTFALEGHAPRALRALVGTAAVVTVVGLSRLLRPAPPAPELPTAEELDRAAALAATSRRTTAWLALLGDKRLLFSDDGRAFAMLAVEGRSWVVLGDPVGPPPAAGELAWRVRDLAEGHGGWPVFYQVGAETLPRYVDMGLRLLKLGETARVPLADWSLEGGARKRLRREVRKVEETGAVLEVLEPAAVPAVLPRLREISDAWLAAKSTAEKGFSLGFFRPDYLARLPLAVVRREGVVVAFANLLPGADREELSVDLMRYAPSAPEGVMTFLFAGLLAWGSAAGYRWFDLGMAPLSGVDTRPGAPLWNRVAGLLYRHAEHFYNFRGLRSYKEKFGPQWEPSYLASPGGLVLPQVLSHLAVLISGGVREVFRR